MTRLKAFSIDNVPALKLWLAAYVALDVCYVVASRKAYMERVNAISAAPAGTVQVAVCALAVYFVLALGWALIAAPAAKDVTSGLKAGALYGLVLYGVFNLTMGAMFKEWTPAIMARDTAWGVTSLAALTAAYGYAVSSSID